MIKSGGKIGEAQGADASATQAGAAAQQDADQGPKAAGRSGQDAAQGGKDAANNIKDNDKKIGQAEALKQDTANTENDLDKAQIYNSGELQRLFAELAKVQNAADEAEAARDEEESRRAEAIADIFDWTEEHRDEVEAFFADEADEAEDEAEAGEAEDSDDQSPDEDDEGLDSSELLEAFYSWMTEATEPLRDEVEAKDDDN